MKFHCPSLYGMDSLKDDSSSAYIIFGSYSNVVDRLNWQKDLALFIDKKLQEGIPILGICFGHQLMADFYGARVVNNINNESYQGVRKVNTQNKELSLFVAHSYQVEEVPSCFMNLGASSLCTNEIIKHRDLPFTGIQGHPEASQFFLDTTLKGVKMTKLEIELASKDGIEFIESFLKEYSLL